MRPGSCPQRHTKPPELSLSVRRAIFASLPIVVALILLPTIAFASPPDPSWIAGIYDGADGDDIVMLVYETAAVEAQSVADISLLPWQTKMALERVPHGVPDHRFARGPRAPPVLRSTWPTLVFWSPPKNTPTASRTESPVDVSLELRLEASRGPVFPVRPDAHPPPTEEERGQ